MEKVIFIPDNFEEPPKDPRQFAPDYIEIRDTPPREIIIPDHYEKRKFRDLVARIVPTIYCYEYPDGEKLFRRGYYLKKIKEGVLLFGAYPSSGAMLYYQKNYNIPQTGVRHAIWPVSLKPKHKVSGVQGKIVFYQPRDCKELYNKYQNLKARMRELMKKSDHRIYDHNISKSAVSNRKLSKARH